MKHLMISQILRRGDGPAGIMMPDSRRNERRFGDFGRLSYHASRVKVEHDDDYNPRNDSCIKAFVRLLAIAATMAAAEAAA